jgi:hypothetical protein
MRLLPIALLPLVLLTACRRPEVEAFGRNPSPIVVDFQAPADDPQSEAVTSEYAGALRAELATCVKVVPEGVPAPEPSASLRVTVTRIRANTQPSPGLIGTATGVAVGTLSAMAGDRDAFFDGLFWGLWTGSAVADSQDYDRYRLGFEPVRVSAVVKLEQRGSNAPLLEFSVESHDVIEQMGYLSPRERGDDARIRKEEAKAFAKVVLARLQEQFHWLPLAEPSYYQPPTPAPVEEPAPDPSEN